MKVPVGPLETARWPAHVAYGLVPDMLAVVVFSVGFIIGSSRSLMLYSN